MSDVKDRVDKAAVDLGGSLLKNTSWLLRGSMTHTIQLILLIHQFCRILPMSRLMAVSALIFGNPKIGSGSRRHRRRLKLWTNSKDRLHLCRGEHRRLKIESPLL